MFKKVEYAGLLGRPDLEAQAQYATDVLGGIVLRWREEVEAVWRPAPPASTDALELTLSLALPNASGSASGRIGQKGFHPSEIHLLRLDLREVWLNLLGELSRQQMKRLDEMLLEPAEA